MTAFAPFIAVHHVLATGHGLAIAAAQWQRLLQAPGLHGLHVSLALPTLYRSDGQRFTPRGDGLELLARGKLTALGLPSWELRRCSAELGEHAALSWVHELAAQQDLPVLYAHTKGASYQPPDPRVEAWRSHLDQLLDSAGHWSARLAEADVDACGPCLLHDRPRGCHWFAGNYWIASSGYLRSLTPYAEYLATPPPGWPPAGERHLAELAIDRDRRLRAIASDGRLYDERNIVALD